jgi:carbon starvation protein
VYNRKANNAWATILGLGLLAGLILLGSRISVRVETQNFASLPFWTIVLLGYCFIASVLPVHLLLQPRDYLSSFLLFAGVAFGYLGLLILRPAVSGPAYVGFIAKEGAIWPMMCVTVACGAISGFHSLISSGTSSKQLANERYASRIGYGGMVAEGLVAVMAVLAVCAGLRGSLPALLKEIGPINAFSKGYGEITKDILSGYGGFIAVTILNAFILTTLDTATRISRYLTEELFGIKNRYLATLIVVILGGALALTGAWQKIWPVFGASNQLVAALALFVISCWLLAHKKTLKFTLVPAIFMFVTTIAALVLQARKYFIAKDYLLLAIAVVLLILAFYLLKEAFQARKRWLS